ncbi:hypothetical protein FQA39_LY04489 [Lamprigera yunnana]|nr:hypothetical protein FQA39_LY04489 [Lamprigera yunnana]
MDKKESSLKILIVKRKKLFKRVQNLYDLEKNIDKPRNVDNFVIIYIRLEKTIEDIEELDININELQLEINQEFTPTFTEAINDLILTLTRDELYSASLILFTYEPSFYDAFKTPIIVTSYDNIDANWDT